MWYIITIVVAVVFFILGYQFAKLRYRVNDLMEALDILSEFILGKISNEEALERFHKITDKFED